MSPANEHRHGRELLCSNPSTTIVKPTVPITTATFPAILFSFTICLLHHLLLLLLPKSLLPSAWRPASASPPASPATDGGDVDHNELKRVFQMFDRNGDGRITQKELSESLENLGIFIPEKDLVAMIEKIDVDGDGCIDIDEFGELYRNIMDDKDEEEGVREAFEVFDQNGDGFITVEELRSVLASLGLKQGRTIEDCKRMIGKVDVDGDGTVNFKEFRQMMKGGGFAAFG